MEMRIDKQGERHKLERRKKKKKVGGEEQFLYSELEGLQCKKQSFRNNEKIA